MINIYKSGVATCSSTHFEEPSHKEIWGEGGGSGTDLISGESFSGNVSVPGLSARYVLVK